MSVSKATLPLASHRLQEKVPFITAWRGETFASPRVVWRGQRIGYTNERPYDRDAFGVLWRRVTNKPGQGKPEYKVVHHTRQRRAMGGLLCQVRAKPTRPEVTDEGILFLLGRREYEFAPWPEPIDTTHPPRCDAVCGDGCHRVPSPSRPLRRRPLPCPHLYGVSGIMHMPGVGVAPIPSEANPVETVPYTSPRKGLVHAAQSVIRLDRYTLVDLESESSALAA